MKNPLSDFPRIKPRSTLYPTMLKLFPEPALEGEAGVRLAQSAARTALETHDRIDSLAGPVLGDTTRNPAARQVAAAERVMQAAQPVFKAFDQANEWLDEEMEHLAGKLDATEKISPSDNHVASEIRSHFKTLDGKQQRKLLDRAKTSGDHLTLKALASAPAFLSGVPEQTIRRAASALHDPETVERLERVLEAKKHLPDHRALFDKKVKQYWTSDVENMVAAAKAAKVA